MRKAHVLLDDMMPMILEQLQNGDRVIFTPRGISMLPTIRGGVDQVVLVSVPPRLRKFDMPLYRRDDGHYVLHRIVSIDRKTGEYTMMGDNQSYPECHVRRDQMLAVVTAVIKNGQETSVGHPLVRLRFRLRHTIRSVRILRRRVVGFMKRIVKR